jgi:hypothetical protein
MTQYSIRETVNDDFLLLCGKLPIADEPIKAWTVIYDGDIACIGSLAKKEGKWILNSDFNPLIKHSAITVFRISCYIMQKALEYEKDIYAYGKITPDKYLLKLGFRFIGTIDELGLGVYRT